MNIYLLTHAREVFKKTNTGGLALDAEPTICQRVMWERVHPDPLMQRLADDDRTALLYPAAELPEDYCEPVAIEAIENFVLLDATWQQARKMYNQSPYLQAMAKFSLDDVAESNFTLRRNQKSGGLCTAECVIEVLRRKGYERKADGLLQGFTAFVQRSA